MKKKDYKRRCEKISLSKCDGGICRAFNPIQLKYAQMLQGDESIVSFHCNVLMNGLAEGEYTTDFVCTKDDGDLMVRECVFRKNLLRPTTAKLLDASREYWLRHGVVDWGLVVDAKE